MIYIVDRCLLQNIGFIFQLTFASVNLNASHTLLFGLVGG